jgi:hypothetical protein
MSYPLNPQSAKIVQMLMEMRTYKEIALTLRVPMAAVKWQVDQRKMLRIPLTREERLWLADKRGIDRKLVP